MYDVIDVFMFLVICLLSAVNFWLGVRWIANVSLNWQTCFLFVAILFGLSRVLISIYPAGDDVLLVLLRLAMLVALVGCVIGMVGVGKEKKSLGFVCGVKVVLFVGILSFLSAHVLRWVLNAVPIPSP